MSAIHYYWRPESEKNITPPSKDDNVGKLYQTTSEHELGGGWIGKVELNQAKLSTVFGGARNPVQPKVDKYVIKWLKWADRKTHYETFSKRSLEGAEEEHLVKRANPDEKQLDRRPSDSRQDWGKTGSVQYGLIDENVIEKPVELPKRNWFVRLIQRLFNL